ncbi:N-acetylglucosaminyldiphosphoundecaprenol N-acetyl-beta-D-mannosaminyltransferase [Filimonas zeae]|uniref:Glycosyl transferase n=1 Tax=Filimonas zeae TaxID=1737353 RepID=A0A917J1D3_9BACT|nr:WecB/TagA/CpsF family glycosyltransferase [Filimonas zeae]MDR6340482.1 N-acetylglucosaminyldiphosphoundecaprenol N-acetyl-beta-D-mannosaminyltransferase [Filimonas zeae]GGH72951.1 glycosyl transferase [Filimonas zeae]
MLARKHILSINVSVGTQQDFVDEIFQFSDLKQSAYICFANVHMLVEAYNSHTFNNVVNSADIVAPDGFPVAKSFGLMYGIKQGRIDGTGVMRRVLSACLLRQKKVFFYGGTQRMLNSAVVYLKLNYPGLQVAGMFSPPFRQLEPTEKKDVTDAIRLSGADFVFVVLGCPKQEAWMHEMKGEFPAVMLGIGGALPMILGMQQRAPVWVQQIGFEWLCRLMQEPGRLFQRYTFTNSKFLYLLAAELCRIQLRKIRPTVWPKIN